MRVPDGIQTAELNVVELEFRLSGPSGEKQQCRNVRKSTQSDYDQTPSRTTTFDAREYDRLSISADHSQPGHIEHDVRRNACNLRQDLPFMDERDVWSNLMSLDHDGLAFQETPESLQHLSSQPERDGSSELISFLDILFAAVRFAITKNPIKLAKGIRIIASKSFRHLSEIAPAVWSPSCCRGLASRAVFLPTIDHALGAVGVTHSLSNTLRAKMIEVQRRSGGSRCVPERLDGGHTDTTTTSPGTAHQLWRTMQHKLLRCEDANRLRPLKEAVLGGIADDEGLMGVEWDFMNETRAEQCLGATSQRSDSSPDSLEEEDMLAAWEDVDLSQCHFEEPAPGIDDMLADQNCYEHHGDLDSLAWTCLRYDTSNLLHLPHQDPSVDMDLMSWETEHNVCEDMLNF
jgi:hypothetical protein